jgi:hypothetical protein
LSIFSVKILRLLMQGRCFFLLKDNRPCYSALQYHPFAAIHPVNLNEIAENLQFILKLWKSKCNMGVFYLLSWRSSVGRAADL